MPNAIQLYSEVHNGHIDSNCRQSIANALKMLDGKRIKVTIEERKRARTLSQNSFYWGVLVPMVVNFMNDYGAIVDGEEVHEFLKQEVMKLRTEITTPEGEIKYITGSTAKLSTLEWEMAIEKVRVWAANVDLILPFPNETLLGE